MPTFFNFKEFIRSVVVVRSFRSAVCHFALLTVMLGTAIVFSAEKPPLSAPLERYEYKAEKMGVPVRIIFYANSEKLAEKVSDDVYARFDELNLVMSDYFPDSEIIRVCRESEKTGGFVPISADLYRVLSESRRFTDLTEGAFDITVSPIVKLWRRSRIFKSLPPAEYLQKAKELTGNRNWELLPDKGVRLLKKNVRFDVGGIAKGFAMDEALKIFEKAGISRVLIDAGGDVRLGDAPPNAKGWRIGIASLAKSGDADRYIEVARCGVATSGDTFRYVEINGVRYSHLIDPRSGQPMTVHRIVTVIAPDGTTADALASAFSILPPEKGLDLARQLKVDLLILRAQKEGVAAFDGPHDLFQTDFFKKNAGKH